MSSNRKIEKLKQKKTSEKRIIKLFELAEESANNNKQKLADRYVKLARKLSMKYLTPIPPIYKKRYCKHCYCYLIPYENSRIRINKGRITIFCKNCNKFTRIPFKNK